MNIKKGNWDNYNYPPGADSDPNCPWNQPPEPETIPWESVCHEDCGNCGAEAVWCNEDGICEFCYDLEPKYYDNEPDETPREDFE